MYNKIKQIEIMSTVYHPTKGQGNLISTDGMWSVVDFGNGNERVVSVTLKKKAIAVKVKSYMKEEVKEVLNFTSIVNQIKGTSTDRGSMFSSIEIFKTIEKLADTQNNFSGSIIADARNGKIISDKQAMVVAYFAKNNGLVK